MTLQLERFINYFKRPIEPEGIAEKIGIELMQSVINLYEDPEFQIDIDVKNSMEKDIMLLLCLMSNSVAFVVLTLQGLAEFMENQEEAEFYKEIAVEVQSFYGNYLKSQNSHDEISVWYEKRLQAEIENFMISYKACKKIIKPMPENNYWVGLAAYVCLLNLRQKKIEEDDPLQMLLVDRIQKIEALVFKVIDEARRQRWDILAS
jgi:hypothetical protein